jgi:hypothetical protein
MRGDHDSYVVRRDPVAAPAPATAPGRELVVLANGVPGSDMTTLARQLAAQLRIPLFSHDVIAPSVADALWALPEDSPVGGVVESWLRPDDALFVVEGVATLRAGPGNGPLRPTAAGETGQGVPRADVVRIAPQVGAGLVPASET